MPTDRSPLAGRRVVVTRPRPQAEALAARLRAEGAEPVILPVIRLVPAADLRPLDRALRDLARYAWVVFTSANAVRLVVERMQALGLAPQALQRARLAAIGPATAAALRTRGLRVDLVPDTFVAESVAAALPDLKGARVLLPRAAGARPVLPQRLRARGAQVEEIPIYRAVTAGPDPEALDGLSRGVQAVTLTSPSTVRGFLEVTRAAGLDPRALPGEPVFACIGPITAAAAREVGLAPLLVAEAYTVEGLLDVLRAHFSQEARNGRRTVPTG